MKQLAPMFAMFGLVISLVTHAGSLGPTSNPHIVPVEAPRDRPYPGLLQVAVDATDINRKVVHVHESLSGIGGETVLLFPKWLPGTHAPEGPIDRLAGLKMMSKGVPVSWTRDPVDVYAFRVHPGAGIGSLDIDFDYLSPTSDAVGAAEIGHDVLMIEWNDLLLYPAGYFARQIPVEASLTLPTGWQFGTALESASAAGARTTFKRTELNTLIDSPVYAGHYALRLDLDPGGPVPVHLDLFADRAQFLAMSSEQLAAHRALVQQAYKLFNSHHYDHYDFLYSLSDEIQHDGLEHHQSSEDGTDPELFTKWDKTAYDRDLLAHEFSHSWNGKFRRPYDLWTPNYNVPMQDSLLWVYEGQTQYWGKVLAARSGLWTRQQALDEIAMTAAYDQIETGRRWRPLKDTTNDEIINPRRPQPWRDWQRFEDYYEESALVWLEVDTLIRERSKDARSLDDFARAFFGINDGSFVTVTYTFNDVVNGLNAVEPYDWASFLHQRLDSIDKPPPLEGLRRGGYKLVYTETPSEVLAAADDKLSRVTLLYSIGIDLDDKDERGKIRQVLWDGPAFKVNLTEGTQILAVNGISYSGDVLKDAIKSAQHDNAPIQLIAKSGDRFIVAELDYHDGLRYPHLERDPSVPARLDEILTARP